MYHSVWYSEFQITAVSGHISERISYLCSNAPWLKTLLQFDNMFPILSYDFLSELLLPCGEL